MNKLKTGLVRKSLMLIIFLSALIVAVTAFLTNEKPERAFAAGWDIVPIDEVYICTDSTAFQGGEMNLNCKTVPEYAIYTATDIRYELLRGVGYAAVEGEKLLVKPDAPIGGEIEVRAVVDGVVSTNTATFKVAETPIQEIKILNSETNIREGETLNLICEVLPHNADASKTEYSVTDGGEYASIDKNGKIIVKDNLPSNDITIKVKVTSKDNPSVYDEKSFELYIPVREITVGNLDITEVEPRRTYDFGGIVDANASNDKLIYSLNVGKDVASISETGVLSVTYNASIGTEIEITVASADGTEVKHSVTVVAVHATSIRLDGVKNQSGTILSESEKIYAGDELAFEISFPTPFNVTESLKTYRVELCGGNTEVAEISADCRNIRVLPQSCIAKKAPSFTVKIWSPDNPEAEPVYREFSVYIKVTGIETEYVSERAYAGQSYAIDELMTATVYPANSEVTEVVYGISEGGNYARIINNSTVEVCTKDILPDGRRTFTVTATAEGFTSERVFSVYVKAESIDFNVENLSDSRYPTNPMSINTSSGVAGYGERMRVTLTADEMATNSRPEISVICGENLIKNFVREGNVITFNVAPDSTGSVIRLEASSDDVIVPLPDIIIYRPVQNITAVTENYDSASGRYLISRNDYSKNILRGFDTGEEWTITSSVGTVDLSNRSMPVLRVPATTKAGTAISVTVCTNDARYRFSQTFTFYVSKLDLSLFAYGVEGNIISFPYGTESKYNSQISQEKPQLWVGYSTTVDITTSDGLGLDYYGLTATGTEITMPSNASGGYSFNPKITISDGIGYDGTANIYELTLPALYAFRPLSGTPALVNGNVAMTTKQKFLSLTSNGTNFDTSATYKLSDLVMYGSNLTGALIGGNRFIIISDSASEYQTIILRCEQRYNGVELTGSDAYYATVTQRVKRMFLDKWGGIGGSNSALAVDGMQTSISVPWRTGYIFGGYYTSAYGSGTKYYDEEGKLLVTHSSFNILNLYAMWTPINYTVECKVYINDTLDRTEYTETWQYDKWYELYVKEEEKEGFQHFLINGVKYPDGEYVHNLTATDGATVEIGVYYTRSSSCVTADTLIRLPDGTEKPIEEIGVGDKVLVFDFRTQSFISTSVILAVCHEPAYQNIITLNFDNGKQLKLVGSHVLFSFTKMKYVTVDAENVKSFIGEQFLCMGDDGAYELTRLTAAGVVTEYTVAYTLVTSYYFNCLTEGIVSATPVIPGIYELTSSYLDENMKFDYDALKKDAELYGLYKYEDFSAYMSEEQFEKLCGGYFKIAAEKGYTTYEEVYSLMVMYSYIYEYDAGEGIDYEKI